MAQKEKNITVYADWDGLDGAFKLGTLHAYAGGGTELFELEYEQAALAHPQIMELRLDPRVGAYVGRQFPQEGAVNFGLFLDSCPDRWGRLLMQRRLERAQRAGTAPKTRRLTESDYLLGVHDLYRPGALRFRLDDAGPFLDDHGDRAAPPFVELRSLEQASLALERDEKGNSDKIDEWLRILIAPGGSLGGARPKASVIDPRGRLWIAKFPSTRDDHDVGAWELIVHSLAQGCGIRVAPARVQRFSSHYHTFLVQRFDRTQSGARLHFASAMTMTGHKDGDDAAIGASYLEIARVLMDHGARPQENLLELWTRIVFNMCVSNTDDHLRNHGFILEPKRGWRLSEAYDMNSVPHSTGLKLNASEADNALDLGLARSVAPLFRVSTEEANSVIARVKKVVSQWPVLAKRLKMSAREQARMAPAFALAESGA